MDTEMVKKYLDEVPLEIRTAIKELSSDARWAVYIALVLEGRKYFNEIKGEFDANPNAMGPILKALADGGLVARRINKFEDFVDKRKIFYEPTRFGIRLFDAFNTVIIPQPPGKQIGGIIATDATMRRIGQYTANTTTMIDSEMRTSQETTMSPERIIVCGVGR